MDDLTRHAMLGDKDAREELVKQTDYEELKGNLIAYAGCGDILSQGDFHSRVISQLLVNATIAISELLERAEKAERERDAAVRDLRERAIESYSECNYCLYRTARSFCSDCSDGSNWKWRGSAGGMNMERYSDEAIRIIDELHTERLDYQSEYIPLIDAAQRLDAYESTGMEPENIGALCKELNQYKDAVERMGNFGRLFVQYSGDPRGQMGHRGNRNDEIENATMFSTIEDVEGDVWRPVLERVLQSLIQRTKKAEQERDAAIADIKHIVCDLYEDDVLCKKFCKNHDGVCSSKAELGLYEDCRGFEWRGMQEE